MIFNAKQVETVDIVEVLPPRELPFPMSVIIPL
jgi:hypothetical protein